MIVADWCSPQCCTLKVFYHQAQNWKVQDCIHLIIWQKMFLSAFKFPKRGFLGIVCVFLGRNSPCRSTVFLCVHRKASILTFWLAGTSKRLWFVLKLTGDERERGLYVFMFFNWWYMDPAAPSTSWNISSFFLLHIFRITCFVSRAAASVPPGLRPTL